MTLPSFYRSTMAAALLTLMTAVGQAQAAAPTSFVLSELQPLAGGTQAYVNAINNLGQIVGSSEYGPGGAVHATLWRDGIATDLGTLGGIGSDAKMLSNSGQIVGLAFNQGPKGGDGDLRNALWRTSSPQTPAIDLGNGRSTAISALNDASLMVGTQYAQPSGLSTGVVITGGVSTPLATLGGMSGAAFGINNQGNIVGASQRAGGGEIQATFWQGQMPIDLGLTGAHGSFAFGINERGQIIGSVVDELWRTTAVTWANGQLTSLEDLGSGFASPSGINDEGLIVGMSETKDFASRAVMWDGAHVIDLNSLLTDDQRAAGWALLSAVDVNDSGIIIGQALKNNVSTNFVLTPVPEARTGMMTLLGMALMVGLFWRRKASQALAAD